MKEIYREYVSGQVNDKRQNFNPKAKQLVARLMKLVPSKSNDKTSFENKVQGLTFTQISSYATKKKTSKKKKTASQDSSYSSYSQVLR
jgi:hypothetical protein